jgi:hypothetical protein
MRIVDISVRGNGHTIGAQDICALCCGIDTHHLGAQIRVVCERFGYSSERSIHKSLSQLISAGRTCPRTITCHVAVRQGEWNLRGASPRIEATNW